MNVKKLISRKITNTDSMHQFLDRLFLPMDKKHIRRTKNIRLIPNKPNRRGGKKSYAEWAHVIGIFQALIYMHLHRDKANRILDVGCGTGLLGIASEPFLDNGGKYTGIDVQKHDIDFCRNNYDKSKFEFVHFDVINPAYSPNQQSNKLNWPVESGSYDLVTALSVWTHLAEDDALFYFKEVSRVLKPGGKAIITFFVIDDTYHRTHELKTNKKGRFHMTPQNRWIFDQPSYGSSMWFHPKWAKIPEHAIGVTDDGLKHLIATSGMKLLEHHQGNWKEVPGLYFQDVLVFEKNE